jgi:hypothetical protein
MLGIGLTDTQVPTASRLTKGIALRTATLAGQALSSTAMVELVSRLHVQTVSAILAPLTTMQRYGAAKMADHLDRITPDPELCGGRRQFAVCAFVLPTS